MESHPTLSITISTKDLSCNEQAFTAIVDEKTVESPSFSPDDSDAKHLALCVFMSIIEHFIQQTLDPVELPEFISTVDAEGNKILVNKQFMGYNSP